VHKLLGKYSMVNLPVVSDVAIREWPGFYCNGAWIKPTLSLQSDCDTESTTSALEDLLNTNNIYIQNLHQIAEPVHI
jgi:hypothetical protein